MVYFGQVLGSTRLGNVTVYSNAFGTKRQRSLIHLMNGINLGLKWQCVEFARRFLYINFGIIFEQIAQADDIFNLRHFTHVETRKNIPVTSLKNGSNIWPHVGSLLIWQSLGNNSDVKVINPGHVAVVVSVSSNFIDIAEQNFNEKKWTKPNRKWSRRLLVSLVPNNNGFHILCDNDNENNSHSHADVILGWVNLPSSSYSIATTDR